MCSDLWQDLRHAVRSLRRSPGFTAAALFTLALGVGGNVALYSVVQAILLRPLPFPDPHRLVFVSSTVNREAGVPVSPPDFIDWRQQGRCFESLAAVFDGRPVNLTGTSEPERLIAARVSADFFSVMRVPALHGRTFSREEDRPGASPVVVLSYGLWQRRFGSDPGVVGKTVVLDGRGHTVVGVMPPQFCYLAGQDAWLPLAVEGIEGWGRRAHVLDVAGRLRQGITVEQADSEMRALAGRIAREHPQTNTGWGAHVVPLDERIVGNTKTALFVLLAAVGLLLLIACANVANLLHRPCSRRSAGGAL